MRALATTTDCKSVHYLQDRISAVFKTAGLMNYCYIFPANPETGSGWGSFLPSEARDECTSTEVIAEKITKST